MNCEDYVHNLANKWLQDNATMYRGDNASDCQIKAYIAGAMQITENIKSDLLPACTKALTAVSQCLSADGDRCAPNMADFVAVASALRIIDDFYQRVNPGA